MAEEAKWKKITDKKYQRLTDEGEWATVDVPYAKVALLFQTYLGGNGLIDPTTGAVKTDLLTLISSFGELGDILLTEYDNQGNVVTPGNTKMMSIAELVPLFEISTAVIENFIGAVSAIQAKTAEPESDEKQKKTKKA